MNVYKFYKPHPKSQVPAFHFVATNPSKVPRPSVCFLILPPFSHMFSKKSKFLGFLQIGRSTKSKSHLFTSGPPTSALQNQALRSQAKILLKSYEYIKTFEGFLKISRPLKILRAKISGMPGASSKFQ
jgi:hypothetical protein